MADQIVPLDAQPNQSFQITLNVNGSPLTLRIVLRYNEFAQYWALTLLNGAGNLLLDSVPLLTGDFPAANILEQYAYLAIGAAYVINSSGVPTPNFPNNKNLGTDFQLVWTDAA